ncbi:MAG: hypothetical protein KGM15_05755 [Pseudomonadota bacterium]|nr:hypothetical protein [Pseudomonadota bacterium]
MKSLAIEAEMLHVAPSSATLSTDMSALDDFLLALRARRDRLTSELEAISEAINKIEEGIRVLPPEALDRIAANMPDFESTQNKPSNPAQRGRGLLPPREIALAAKSALLAIGRPMKRGALVAELKKRGVPLAGTDIHKNLGTILWRHSEMFVSLEGLGYWVKGAPIAGIYEPEE